MESDSHNIKEEQEQIENMENDGTYQFSLMLTIFI